MTDMTLSNLAVAKNQNLRAQPPSIVTLAPLTTSSIKAYANASPSREESAHRKTNASLAATILASTPKALPTPTKMLTTESPRMSKQLSEISSATSLPRVSLKPLKVQSSSERSRFYCAASDA